MSDQSAPNPSKVASQFLGVAQTKTASGPQFHAPYGGVVSITVKDVLLVPTDQEMPFWDVTGAIGLFPLTFTELPFKARIQGGHYVSLGGFNLPGEDKRITNWMARLFDDYLKEGTNARKFAEYLEQQAGR